MSYAEMLLKSRLNLFAKTQSNWTANGRLHSLETPQSCDSMASYVRIDTCLLFVFTNN